MMELLKFFHTICCLCLFCFCFQVNSSLRLRLISSNDFKRGAPTAARWWFSSDPHQSFPPRPPWFRRRRPNGSSPWSRVTPSASPTRSADPWKRTSGSTCFPMLFSAVFPRLVQVLATVRWIWRSVSPSLRSALVNRLFVLPFLQLIALQGCWTLLRACLRQPGGPEGSRLRLWGGRVGGWATDMQLTGLSG